MHSARRVVRALGLTAFAALVVSGVAHLDPAGASAPALAGGKPGLDAAIRDPKCRACDDFYEFATGNFAKIHPPPAGYPYWDNFSVLDDDNTAVLHGILETAAHDTAAPAGSNEQKIGAFYGSCMNEAAIAAAGLTPLQAQLGAIAGVTDVASLGTVAAALAPLGVNLGWTLVSDTDLRDSSKTIAEVDHSGLGMPDRDYYLLDDARTKAIRAAYVTYVTTLLAASGLDAASAASGAQNVLALETVLAKATPTRADLRDPLRTYHPQSLDALQKLVPAIDWTAYANAAGAPAFTSLNVELPDYMAVLQTQLTSTPIAVWKQYATFRLLNSYATALPKPIDDARFAFYGTTLEGTKEQRPRYKRCVAATDGALGEALGAVYVAKMFSPAAKARAKALVDNLQSVLAGDIETLPWMSAPTKARAEIKLAAFTKKIGYPDHFRDYSALNVDASAPYATNLQAARRFENAHDLSKIGKPTDRLEWGMSPPTVNAYYNSSNNEIVFPAGILRAPFFDERNDDAINYGAIGAVIGHEMTHGFDDQGRQFDQYGNHTNWWTPADAKRFDARANCIVDEFNHFQVEPGAYENGRLVQGEAIADLGGITIAYKAFEKTPEFKAGKLIDGFTPQQRFFLAYAQIWASVRTPEFARELAKTDPHPDDKMRVDGTLANMPEFAAAFGCKVPDKMVRTNACRIW